MDINKINLKIALKNAAMLRDFIFDLIFPIECVECGKEGEFLCAECFLKLNFNNIQYCLNCKKIGEKGEFCSLCRKKYYLDGVLIAGNYDHKILSKLIKTYKYKFAKKIATPLSLYLEKFIKIRNFEPMIKSYNCVVPIPLSKNRLNWRGFNQSEEIARIISDKYNLKLINGSLIRTKNKKPQAKLKEKERIENVEECFAWRDDKKNPLLIKGKKIILIDDIVTTGATLNECAKILKENGAKKVWGIVIAKG